MTFPKIRPSPQHISLLAAITLYVLSTLYFLLSMSIPKGELVKMFYECIAIGVPECFLLFAVFGTFVQDTSNDREFVFHKIGLKLVRVLWVYVAVLWATGNFGDLACAWILQNPQDILVLVASLLGIGFVMMFSAGPANVPLTTMLAWGPLTLIRPRPSPATEQDEKYAAVHESGHALIYAALGSLPENMRAVVFDVRGRGTRIGNVRPLILPHHLPEKTLAEWKMLVMLAGKFAENRVFGENTLGSAGDHGAWTSLAELYLLNHFDGLFYYGPENEQQQAHNEKKLMQLQDKQKAVLSHFFELNDNVFKDLASELLSRRKLNRADLVLFMRRVKIPEGFPLPFGPFAEFSSEALDGSKNPKHAGLFPSCEGLKA